MLRLTALCAALLASAPAFASRPIPIPEPGSLGLLAIGAVAGVVAWVRRRK